MALAIGKPKYGKDSGKKNTHKIQDGSNVYRIAPAVGSEASDTGKGRVAVYHRVHWGYFWSNDKGEKMLAPIECIRRKNFKSGMVEQECPFCVDLEDKEAQQKSAKAEYSKQLVDGGSYKTIEEALKSEELKEYVEPLTEWLKSHNVDGKWHLNAKSTAGSWGKLAIPDKSKKSLFLRIQELRTDDPEFDPCGIETGVWFDFVRTPGATFRDTHHEVHVVKEVVKENGKRAEYIKEAPLTEEELTALGEEAWDLGPGLFRILSEEQMQKIVNSEGDPEVVKAILFAAEKQEAKKEEPAAKPTVTPKAPVQRTAPVAAPAPAEPSDEVDPEIAELEKKLEAARAAKLKAAAAPIAAPKVQVRQAAAPESVSPMEMSDADFEKMFAGGGLAGNQQ